MYDDFSAVNQVTSTLIKLDNNASAAVEINPQKLKNMLKKYHCFPADHRKQIWSHLLQLPRNQEAFEQFMSKAPLPHAKKLCLQKGCKGRVIKLVNALIHWHASLINCEWLPLFVQKLDKAFGSDQLFCFEVTLTCLTNFFAEWLSELPGPPPDVLSRIDAIFAHNDPLLRYDLGTALVIWPVYRSFFAEILYDRAWLELMDVILSSNLQFYEFLVVAWMEINGDQLRIDASTFHSTRRPVNTVQLIKKAEEVCQYIPRNLQSNAVFRILPSPNYPIIEANTDAVVLRTLQSDHDRLAALQKQLLDERRIADDAELTKKRKQETFESIQRLHQKKEEKERIATAKAAGDLDQQMKKLRLEGKLIKQSDERQFLESWQAEWRNGIDTTSTFINKPYAGMKSKEVLDDDEIRFQSLKNLRQSDYMTRDARKTSVARGKHARNELDAQIHETAVHTELMQLSFNPDLANMSVIKSTKPSLA